MSLFLAFKSKKQAYLEPEFEASLVYRLISRTVRALTQRNSVLKNITKKQDKLFIKPVLCSTLSTSKLSSGKNVS